MKVEEPKVSITLTKTELWELMNNFGLSFESGHPDNKIADRVSTKLHKAYEKVKNKL